MQYYTNLIQRGPFNDNVINGIPGKDCSSETIEYSSDQKCRYSYPFKLNPIFESFILDYSKPDKSLVKKLMNKILSPLQGGFINRCGKNLSKRNPECNADILELDLLNFNYILTHRGKTFKTKEQGGGNRKQKKNGRGVSAPGAVCFFPEPRRRPRFLRAGTRWVGQVGGVCPGIPRSAEGPPLWARAACPAFPTGG